MHETIRELLSRRPFTPFEVRMSSGDVHEVRRPEFAILLKSTLVIGVPDTDRVGICALFHVANVNNLTGKPSRRNGKTA